MMRVPRLLWLAAALAALPLASGCLKRTKISETYVLDAVAARDVPAPSETPEAVVGVLRVSVPGWIDRPQLIDEAARARQQALADAVAARTGAERAAAAVRQAVELAAAAREARRAAAARDEDEAIVQLLLVA